MTSLIVKIFEESTMTSFPQHGKTVSLSQDNINDLFQAIAAELAEIDFRSEIGCTRDDDYKISGLIENHFKG